MSDDDVLDPPRSLGIGAAKVLPQEYPGLRVAHIDVNDAPDVAEQVVRELAAGATESEVALRHGRRYIRVYEPVTIPDTSPPLGLPPNPVILITGGLGYIGLTVAEAVFSELGARLVLVSRSQLPPSQEWQAMSESPGTSPEQRAVLRRLTLMSAERDDVLVVAAELGGPDCGQRRDRYRGQPVRIAIDLVSPRSGPAPARLRARVGCFGHRSSPPSRRRHGLLRLVEAMRGREPRRWVVHGSISSVLGGLGLAAYAGANAASKPWPPAGRVAARIGSSSAGTRGTTPAKPRTWPGTRRSSPRRGARCSSVCSGHKSARQWSCPSMTSKAGSIPGCDSTACPGRTARPTPPEPVNDLRGPRHGNRKGSGRRRLHARPELRRRS